MMARFPWIMAALVALATVAFGVSSFVIPDFGGFEPQQFPIPQDDPPVQPAGYAFAIWAVIYIWLVVGAGFGLVLRAEAPDWQEMRPYLFLSLVAGASWLAVAKLSALGATVLIWVMLIPALQALHRAPALDRWFGRGPVGLYAGWLTAASCVAIGLVLAGYLGTDPVNAAIISLLGALALAGFVLWHLPDIPEYGLAVIWALVAVAVQNLNGAFSVFVLALIGAALVLVLTVRSVQRR